MNNLIMRIRLESLNKNLIKVKEPFKQIDERFKEIEDLLHVLISEGDSIYSSLDKIKEDVDFVYGKVLSMQEDHENRLRIHPKKLEESKSHLVEALSHIEKTSDFLKSARKKVDLTQKRCLRIARGESLQLMLSSESDEMIAKVNAISRDLEENQKGCNNDRAGNLFNAWKNLSRLTYQESPRIFSEYVDFLRGMALRSTGFDSEICKISDELIKRCKEAGNVAWESITIPDQKEALTITLARIIRMGFPEWSIWTLPLTAHEFGHVVAREKMARFITDQSAAKNPPSVILEEYIADAFATYSMGPAYAYAAILLRFDPFLAYFDKYENPSYAKRAFVIFKILQKMQEKTSRDDPTANKEAYKDVIAVLTKEWRAALTQAKLPENQVDKDEIEQLRTTLRCLKNHPPKAESEDYFITIEMLKNEMEFILQNACMVDAIRDEDALIKEDRDFLSKFVDSLWLVLNPIAVGYPTTSWQRSKDLGAKLLSNDKIEAHSSIELRDVLNAAWHIRVTSANQSDQTDHIEERAQEKMKEILEKIEQSEEQNLRFPYPGGY